MFDVDGTQCHIKTQFVNVSISLKEKLQKYMKTDIIMQRKNYLRKIIL